MDAWYDTVSLGLFDHGGSMFQRRWLFWSISSYTEALIFTQSSGDSNSSADWPNILLTQSLVQRIWQLQTLEGNFTPILLFYLSALKVKSCLYVWRLTSMCCYVSWGLGRPFTSHGPICCCLTSKSSCCRAFGWSFSSSILGIKISWIFWGVGSRNDGRWGVVSRSNMNKITPPVFWGSRYFCRSNTSMNLWWSLEHICTSSYLYIYSGISSIILHGYAVYRFW